jgi:MFS family permease
MFALLLVSYVINAMDRQLFSVLAPDVRDALGFSLPQLGLLSTVFTLGMGVAGLPAGFLLARVSRRALALCGLALFSAATALTAVATGFWDLFAYRFVSGVGEAMQLTALLAIGTAYFVRHRGLAASSLNFTFGVGAIIGPNLGAAILAATDWPVPFVVFGLAGFAVLPVVALVPRTGRTSGRGRALSVTGPAEKGAADQVACERASQPAHRADAAASTQQRPCAVSGADEVVSTGIPPGRCGATSTPVPPLRWCSRSAADEVLRPTSGSL